MPKREESAFLGEKNNEGRFCELRVKHSRSGSVFKGPNCDGLTLVTGAQMDAYQCLDLNCRGVFKLNKDGTFFKLDTF